MPAPGIGLTPFELLSQMCGTQPSHNPHDDVEWTTYSAPTNVQDTRRWGIAGSDLGFPYDGKDGFVYCFLGDTFGSRWTGPNTIMVAGASRTIAAASNNVLLSDIGGSVTTLTLSSGTGFPTTGMPCVGIRVSADSNRIAWIRYTSRSAAVISGCSLIYAPDSTKRLTTGDVIQCNGSFGDGWRSNTLFRTSDTDLSNGVTIESFRPVNADNVALQAIPGMTESQDPTNVFPISRTISAISRSSNVVTLTISAGSLRMVEGQAVTVFGVTDTSFNGSFVVTEIVSSTQLRYSQVGANASSAGGFLHPTSQITAATGFFGVTVRIDTNVAHGLQVGMIVDINDTGMNGGSGNLDKPCLVHIVESPTRFQVLSAYTGGPASSGTVTPAVFAFSADGGGQSVDPADDFEGTLIPSGAIAIEFQSAPASITNASWSSNVATITVPGGHHAYVGEKVLVEGLAPSSLNGEHTVTAVDATHISYALAGGATVTDGVGTVKWTRHYAYVQSINTFSAEPTIAGAWTNFMGIAYSDDKGLTPFTRYGVSGATYNNADTTKVWSNDRWFMDNFQNVWPVLHDDGYVYCFSTRNGRYGPMMLMRVPKEDILEKSEYTYWDGSSWSSDITDAVNIFETYSNSSGIQYCVSESGVQRHAATGLFIATTYNQLDRGLELRTASNPWGPWSDPIMVLSNDDFGANDGYGGWTWPQRTTDDPKVLRVVWSLFSPYASYLFETEITAPSDFFSFMRRPHR